MKKLSELKEIKVLSKKEQNKINGANGGNVICKPDNRCYLHISPNIETLLGYCRYGIDSGCAIYV